MKSPLIAASILLALSIGITSCAEPELDFSEHELDNVIQIPPETRRINFNNNPLIFIPCNQEITITVTDVTGLLGLFTLKSYKSAVDVTNPAARGNFNCDIEVTITRKRNGAAIPGNFTYPLKAGETLTSIFPLDNANSLDVKLKCSGTQRYCLFFQPEFKTGKLVPKGRKRYVELAELDSNPRGAREFTPTNAGGGNRCNTNETDIHTIHIAFDAKKLKTTATVIARSHCDCEKFIAKVYHDNKTDESESKGNRQEGDEVTIPEIKPNQTIRITGRCEGPANGNAECNGDAIVYFSKK